MSLVIIDRNLNRSERRTSAIIWMCSVALVIFILWAHFAILDEVTLGTGKVTPSSKAETAMGSLPLRGWSDRSFENSREGHGETSRLSLR